MKYKMFSLLGLCALLLALSGCAPMNNLGDTISADIAGKAGDKYYNEKNYPAAFSKYQEAANLGGEYGQFMLASMYLEGSGAERDYEKYLFWMSRSAENGYIPANYAMGHTKLKTDPAAAVSYFRRAADGEHGGAMFTLGYLYATGYGVSQSNYEAVRWFRLAQAQNYPVPSELLYEQSLPGYIAQDIKEIKAEIGYSQKEIVTFIQRNLAKLGYNPGVADGIYGKKTKSAIEAFQRDQGIKVDGVANRALMDKLQDAQAQ